VPATPPAMNAWDACELPARPARPRKPPAAVHPRLGGGGPTSSRVEDARQRPGHAADASSILHAAQPVASRLWCKLRPIAERKYSGRARAMQPLRGFPCGRGSRRLPEDGPCQRHIMARAVVRKRKV
jgi:hypothetical protein